jgi:hypothetical protein
MLFPYVTNVEGDAYLENPLGHNELPQTEWSKDQKELTVTIGEQVDQYTFSKQKNGQTQVSMIRNGQKVY